MTCYIIDICYNRGDAAVSLVIVALSVLSATDVVEWRVVLFDLPPCLFVFVSVCLSA